MTRAGFPCSTEKEDPVDFVEDTRNKRRWEGQRVTLMVVFGVVVVVIVRVFFVGLDCATKIMSTECHFWSSHNSVGSWVGLVVDSSVGVLGWVHPCSFRLLPGSLFGSS